MKLTGLRFADLRDANRARVGLFKNKHGKAAHTTTDGSDWTPAQWFQAWIGEVGEFAAERLAFEENLISAEQYAQAAAQELPDSVIYQDLLAMRALDTTVGAADMDPATTLMRHMAALGTYANLRKKLDRGDLELAEYTLQAGEVLQQARATMQDLIENFDYPVSRRTLLPHPTGVDLGNATVAKFNAVSERVGSSVRLTEFGFAI